MAELGYVGLGVMGGGVAKRLLDAGHTVTGWNRTKDKGQWLLEAGMRWGESPRDVAERSEIVFTMVTNTAAVKAVTEGPQGILAGLAPGKVYVDMSTASPAGRRRGSWSAWSRERSTSWCRTPPRPTPRARSARASVSP